MGAGNRLLARARIVLYASAGSVRGEASRDPDTRARSRTESRSEEDAREESRSSAATFVCSHRKPSSTSQRSGPLGMRYSVLKRNAAGEYQEVDADTVFHSGDRIRLEAQANSTGYLYVVAQGSSGNWQVLFPSREVSNGSNQVHRGETRLVPGGNQGQFVFDEQAGTEKLFFVLSRQPEPSLDKLIYSMGGQTAPADPTVVKPAAESNRVLMAQATVSDDVIARIRSQMQARDLIFEKVDNEKVVSQNDAPAGAASQDRDRGLRGESQHRTGRAAGGGSEVETSVMRILAIAALCR